MRTEKKVTEEEPQNILLTLLKIETAQGIQMAMNRLDGIERNV